VRCALGAWLVLVLSSVDGELEGKRPLSAYEDTGEDPPAELLMPVSTVAAASARQSKSTVHGESLRARLRARSVKESGGEDEAELAFVTKCIEVRVLRLLCVPPDHTCPRPRSGVLYPSSLLTNFLAPPDAGPAEQLWLLRVL